MSDIHAYKEKKVVIDGRYSIAATLTHPESRNRDKYPAVLLIQGSGKMDRDVNAPQIKTNIFKDLALFFAKNNVISLRYDKRGCGESGGNFYQAGLSDYVEDALSALTFLRNQSMVDTTKILVLGHSEGAFIAPEVCTKFSTGVSGLILLCGGIDNGKELLPVQPTKVSQEIQSLSGLKGVLLRLFKIDKFILWQFQKTLNKCLITDKPVIKILGLFKFNAKWLREFYAYKVKDFLPKVHCPTLVIGGEKDVQCDPCDAKKIAQNIENSTSVVVKDLNHLLREFKGKHTLLSCVKEYKQLIKEPISPDLFKEIALWLDRNTFK